MKPLLWIGGALVFSLLPIWRGAGNTRHNGINAWQFFAQDAGLPVEEWRALHIPYSEAVAKAHAAWEATLV